MYILYTVYIYIYNYIIYVYIHTILGITQQQLPAFEQRINSFVINPMGKHCIRQDLFATPWLRAKPRGCSEVRAARSRSDGPRWGTGLKGKCYRQQNVFSRLQSPMVVLQFLSTKKSRKWNQFSWPRIGKGCRTLGMVQWSVDEKSTSVETTIIHYLLWLVVSTPEKYESQLGWLFQIYGKNKKAVSPRKTTITVNIWGKKQVLFAAPELNRIRIDAPFSRNPSRLVARSTKPKTNCKVQKS